jgi:hypothetical protein
LGLPDASGARFHPQLLLIDRVSGMEKSEKFGNVAGGKVKIMRENYENI